jgi:hypothetical protein
MVGLIYANIEPRYLSIAIPQSPNQLTMASSQPVHSHGVVDLEKREDDGDGSSIRTACSSMQHDEDHDTEPQAVPTATKEDIEAYPNGMLEPHGVETEMSRTSTRSSLWDVSKVVTRMSTKSSWRDPGPPPDGGLLAWTQVAMGHLVIMNTWSVPLHTAK